MFKKNHLDLPKKHPNLPKTSIQIFRESSSFSPSFSLNLEQYELAQCRVSTISTICVLDQRIKFSFSSPDIVRESPPCFPALSLNWEQFERAQVWFSTKPQIPRRAVAEFFFRGSKFFEDFHVFRPSLSLGSRLTGTTYDSDKCKNWSWGRKLKKFRTNRHICSGFFLTPFPTSPRYANLTSTEIDLQY